MSETDILRSLEHWCLQDPDAIAFYAEAMSKGENSEYESVSYAQLRRNVVHLASALYDQGVERGDWCVSSMGNCPELVYLIISAAIGGFKLAILNSQLTLDERRIRIEEVQNIAGTGNIKVLSRDDVINAIAFDEKQYGEDEFDAASLLSRSADAFIPEKEAISVFATSSYGKPRAIIFSWSNLIGAARSVNVTVSQEGEGLWQLAMPLHRVGGMQVLFRSLLNGNPFVLYRSYDVQRILDDAVRFDTSHVSIWGSSLKDMLELIPEESPNALAFKGYECIMLGGSLPDAKVLWKAAALGARVYACFGMAETSGNVAACLVSKNYDGKIYSLPGYQLAVVAPDESGYGQLAVKGPGVVAREFNPHLAFTADGFLLTGTLAKIDEPGVRFFRSADPSFVSKGEDINPKEIQDRLLQVPGVTDAYVFADENDEWGRRPVAIVEVAGVSRETGVNLQMLANEVGISLANKLTPMLRPDRIVAVPGFPRFADGRADYEQLRLLFSQRIDIRKVEAFLIKVPLSNPMFVGNVKLKEREYLTIRVTDWQGRTGIGECVALPSICHPKRSLEDESIFIRDSLVSLVKGYVYVHPSQASVLIRSAQEARLHPMGCSALENAIWDLNGKIISSSMSGMIGAKAETSQSDEPQSVPAGYVVCGATIGFKSEQDALEKVRTAVESGCRRVRLRIRPGRDVSVIDAIRREFPKLSLVLDAGKSYNESNIEVLREMDCSGTACIVDPLDPAYKPKVGPQGIWERLVRLQRDMSTPICIDDTWTSLADLYQVISDYPAIRCIALKLSKMGGVQPALEFYWQARERGVSMWMASDGGTSVSSRLQAAFCGLPGMNVEGDFPVPPCEVLDDACIPAMCLDGCMLKVNPEDQPFGLGCCLDEESNSERIKLIWQD